MDAIQILEVPDRISGSSALVNRRLTDYLARRAAGEPPRSSVPSNVTFRPMTDEERAAREERLRNRNPEKREASYAYRRSAVEAYRPRPVQTNPPTPTAPPADPQPEPDDSRGSKWPHPKRRVRRWRTARPVRGVDLNRDLNGMIRKWLGV